MGSTGSIGRNALLCVDYLNEDPSHETIYDIVGLSCKENTQLFLKQIERYEPKVVSIENVSAFNAVKHHIPPNIAAFTGQEGILKAIDEISSYDLCLNALVGSAGILPTYESIKKGANILLANKESLVAAGDVIMEEARKKGVPIIPVDSEHAAIFELFKIISNNKNILSKIILTASGGPFFFSRPKNPTLKEALSHPTWKMGKKITIDSATMMNKGFEVIEARHLFELDYSKIDVVIHPQSVVHSLVETVEGNLYAQMGPSDMRRPIQNALTHPNIVSNGLPKLKLEDLSKLSFHKPDESYFPLLNLAFECGKKGGNLPAALNALNEVAVELFLREETTYNEIYPFIVKGLEKHPFKPNPSLEEILALDQDIKKTLGVG